MSKFVIEDFLVVSLNLDEIFQLTQIKTKTLLPRIAIFDRDNSILV